MSKVIVKLGEICEIKGGKRLPKGSDFSETGYPYIRARDIKNGRVTFDSPVFINDELRSRLQRYKVKANDICVTIVGINVGDTGIVPASLDDANLTENAAKLTNLNGILPHYLNYYLLVDGIKEQLKSYSTGSAQDKLALYKLGKLDVILPSISNQQKIAGILSAYDELIENNKKRIALLETMAEELYKEWFVRFRFPNYENTEFEKGMPKNWHTELIKNLVDRKRFGKLFKEDEVSEKGNIPVYDQSRDNFFGFYNGEPEHKASFENPIIIFGDHTCKMKILFSDFSLAENVIPLKAKDNVNLNYLFYLIKDSVKTTEYKRHWTELTNKKVLIAPIELQNKFSEIIQGNLKMIDNLVHQNFKLAESRDSLLPRLISGKLSVENLDVQQPPTPAQPNDSE